jgi:predicted enzyme related to lactoylglutathione lyase
MLSLHHYTIRFVNPDGRVESAAVAEVRGGAVIYVSDLDRVRRFYEAVCGLTAAESGPDSVTLRSGATALHLVVVPRAIAPTISVSDPPQRRVHTPIKLVFVVTDLAVARRRAADAGGTLDEAAHEWRHGDAVVCDGHDPEGNVVQLRAAAT